MPKLPIDARIIHFADQVFREQQDHGGIGLVQSSRAIQRSDGLNGNFIDCVRVPAGASIGMHTHQADNEELYIILAGSGTMLVEDTQKAVGPGDVIINPPGGTHGLRNDSEEDLTLIVVEYPARP